MFPNFTTLPSTCQLRLQLSLSRSIGPAISGKCLLGQRLPSTWRYSWSWSLPSFIANWPDPHPCSSFGPPSYRLRNRYSSVFPGSFCIARHSPYMTSTQRPIPALSRHKSRGLTNRFLWSQLKRSYGEIWLPFQIWVWSQGMFTLTFGFPRH